MFRKSPKELLMALRVTLVIAVVGGLLYPLAMTGVAQVIFPSQANGGLIKNSSGTIIGATLIGQCFYETTGGGSTLAYRTTAYQGHTFYTVDPRYFQGRPSYAESTASNGTESIVPLDPPCNPLLSQGSNLAPSNALLISEVDAYASYLHCVDVDISGSYTAAELQQAVSDPTHHCLSNGVSTTPVPVDLVTGDFTSFDPDISQAAALAQVEMVASARAISSSRLTQLVDANVTGRSAGILGEPVVNVLQLNLAVNSTFGQPPALG